MAIFGNSNIKDKLDKTGNKISTGIFSIFTGKKIDDELLEELEEILITSDLGINITNKILAEIKNLQDATYSMKQGMDEMSEGAKHINQTSANLADISEKMDTSIKMMGDQVDQFHV